MIVCSFNITGLGSRVKRRKVLELVRRERVEVLALEETKLELVMGNLCVKLWGEFRSRVGFCFFRFVIVIVCWQCGPWDENKGNFISSLQGQGLLGICLEGGVKRKRCIVLNVCVPCIFLGKKQQWGFILMQLDWWKKGVGWSCQGWHVVKEEGLLGFKCQDLPTYLFLEGGLLGFNWMENVWVDWIVCWFLMIGKLSGELVTFGIFIETSQIIDDYHSLIMRSLIGVQNLLDLIIYGSRIRTLRRLLWGLERLSFEWLNGCRVGFNEDWYAWIKVCALGYFVGIREWESNKNKLIE